MDVLSVIVNGRWEIGIGDPDPLGWIITLAYFVACGMCVWAGLREREAAPRAAETLVWKFWFVLAGVLCFLGFNKQLDLQSLLTQIGRDMARSEGWYGRRRGVQAVFVVLVALAGAGVVAWGAWHMRHVFKRYRMAFVGIIYLLCFVVIRAASLHHVDGLLKSSLCGLRLNTALELAGSGVIMYAAFKAAKAEHRAKYVSFEKKVSVR